MTLRRSTTKNKSYNANLAVCDVFNAPEVYVEVDRRIVYSWGISNAYCIGCFFIYLRQQGLQDEAHYNKHGSKHAGYLEMNLGVFKNITCCTTQDVIRMLMDMQCIGNIKNVIKQFYFIYEDRRAFYKMELMDHVEGNYSG